MLSRGGASVFQLLEVPHRSYPFRLFLLIDNAGMRANLASDPDCTRDDFSKALLKRYPGFEGEECVKVLESIAFKQSTDIGGVEARHASIRRQMTAKSVHTWTFDVLSASAEWVLQNFRRAAADVEDRGRPLKKQRSSLWKHQKVPSKWGCVATGHPLSGVS